MSADSYRIEHYRRTRFFALYDDKDELVTVTTYRKGANAVKDRLEAQDRKLAELQAQFNALAAAHAVPSPEETLPALSQNGSPILRGEQEPL